jgi:ketosteroid isomerase-like protein
MNTQQVANRLVELCRRGEFSQAQEELYAADAVSLEPEGAPAGALGSVRGLEAIRQKGKAFDQTYEKMHSVTLSDPLVAGDYFSVALGLDATWKQGGRYAMEEICVYRVRDGKIVLEQFFYPVG